MRKRIFLNIIVGVFIFLFLYSAMNKLFDYKGFISEIKQSPFLKSAPIWLSWIIPGAELAVVIMLVTIPWRLRGLYVCCLLMALFTLYIVAISQFTYYVPCSCGGFLDKLPQNAHILLNCSLVLLATLGIYLQKSIENTFHRHKNIAQDVPKMP